MVVHGDHHIICHEAGFGDGIGNTFQVDRIAFGDDLRLFRSFKHQLTEGLLALFELGEITFGADDLIFGIDAEIGGNAFEMLQISRRKMVSFVDADAVQTGAAGERGGLFARHGFRIEGHAASDKGIAAAYRVNVNRTGRIGKRASGTGIRHIGFFKIFEGLDQAAVGIVQCVIVGGAEDIHTEFAQVINDPGR